MTTPELLAPAGTPEHLETAFAYGADAVYAGQQVGADVPRGAEKKRLVPGMQHLTHSPDRLKGDGVWGAR